jgi:hypothetical protein
MMRISVEENIRNNNAHRLSLKRLASPRYTKQGDQNSRATFEKPQLGACPLSAAYVRMVGDTKKTGNFNWWRVHNESSGKEARSAYWTT